MLTPASIIIGFALINATTPYIIGPPLGKRANIILPTFKKRNTGGAISPVVAAIRDLDVDYRAGIINPEDYQIARSQLLKQAEQFYNQQSQKKRDAVEDLITRKKNQADQQTLCPNCESVVKTDDRFCTTCGSVLSQDCPNCQNPVHSEDRFCSICGEPQ